ARFYPSAVTILFYFEYQCFFVYLRPPLSYTLFPYTTLFRSFGGDPQRQLLRLLGPLFGQPGRGREDLGVDAVALHGLHDRPRRALPERRAGHQRGQFPPHGDLLLLQQPRTRVEEFGHQRSRLVGRGDHPHTAAVVATGGGLEHDGPGMGLPELEHVIDPGDRRERGYREALGGQPFAHQEFVLREGEGGRARTHHDPVRFEGRHVLTGHVFVVERQNVDTTRERAQRLQVGVLPEGDVARHEGGG